MQTIILDTNFLMIPAQFRVDIFSEIRRICNFRYELAVADKTLEELAKILEKGGKAKAQALLAMKLLDACKVRILSSKTATFKNVDKIILFLAAREKAIVATQDAALRKELKKLGLKAIALRQKKYLEILE